MRVAFTEPAEADLEEIGDWIARDNPARAASFVLELRALCLDIGRRPRAYPFVPHRRPDSIRRRVHGNYLIFYRIGEAAVEILQVLHGARDYESVIFPDEPS